MKNKLLFLTSVSLKRKIKTKWFVIANILLFIGIVGVFNIDSVIHFFGGDFNEKMEVYVLDDTKRAYEIFNQELNTIENSYEENSYQIQKYNRLKTDLEKEIKDEDKKMGIILEDDPNHVLKATIISNGYLDTINYQILYSAMKNTKVTLAIKDSNISKEELNKIYGEMDIKREILDDTKQSEEESMEAIMSAIFPIVILPFFMLTIFLVQMIGAEVNDEKTTRGMEIIISNVSPKTHFFSKLLAGNIFVIMQGILFLLYSGCGFFIRSILQGATNLSGITTVISEIGSSIFTQGFIDRLVYLIPLTLILMLLTFFAYSIIAGVLASITTNTEDFQQVQTPIMIVLLIGYYLAIMASSFKGALLIRILSYVPLISAILSPSLLVIGQIGISDVLLSIVIMLITNYLLLHYGLRVYKVGILNYSSEKLWKKMFRALKIKK